MPRSRVGRASHHGRDSRAEISPRHARALSRARRVLHAESAAVLEIPRRGANARNRTGLNRPHVSGSRLRRGPAPMPEFLTNAFKPAGAIPPSAILLRLTVALVLGVLVAWI